jgi:hypothetical protein
MTVSEMEDVITPLMRSIDKRTTLRIEASADPNRPGVTVHLARGQRRGSLEVAESLLLGARADLATRNRLRTALKRARDRMWEETSYIFSTKKEYSKIEGQQWQRPMQRGRGRR